MSVSHALRHGNRAKTQSMASFHTIVALPESPEELAQILADASRDRQLTVLRGGGSKLEWGRVPDRIDLVIGTEKLDRLLAHRYGDMTVTAQAGMPLASLNRRLAEHRQYLPDRERVRAAQRSAALSRPTMPGRCAIASARRAIC